MTDDLLIINDEEPDSDAMARLWAALDASLDPPPAARPPVGSTGSCECLRCGWKWTPRKPGTPRSCPMPYCHSAYWNVAPQRKYARTPQRTDLDRVRVQIVRDRVLLARKQQTRTLHARAKKLGFVIGPARGMPGYQRPERPQRGKPPMRIVDRRPESTPLDRVTAEFQVPKLASAVPFRPTVPPPPGLDDLQTRED